ncbi:hypothetical protein [Halalkalibacter okhensis]|uniref:Uncharacterized protein n=1 Tax=Halalkalibacter okhensis TaxID=333138 RepID=A0A0B0IM38_9BACI|nr:hypothetical protein [Halalkalibacter okhensis]KHF41917.1 hypothetical protein LQ50_01095 [Halalkalibacter okhensis]
MLFLGGPFTGVSFGGGTESPGAEVGYGTAAAPASKYYGVGVDYADPVTAYEYGIPTSEYPTSTTEDEFAFVVVLFILLVTNGLT